jgi:Lar family restriction alleviation protein
MAGSGSEALKSCPFCSGVAELQQTEGSQARAHEPVHRAHCVECDVALDWCESEAEAIAAWNRRTVPQINAEHRTSDDEKAFEAECASTGLHVADRPVAWHFYIAGRASTREVTEALRALIDHFDRDTCAHENTHRGGTLWTICGDCGAKWADDEGGFTPYCDPPAVASARAALTAALTPSPTLGDLTQARDKIDAAEDVERLRTEVGRLREALGRVCDVTQTFIRETTDPGSEALAAMYCARALLGAGEGGRE